MNNLNFDYLKKRFEKKKKVNLLWEKAEEIAKLTGTKPNRWLREIKNNSWAVDRALIDFKEANKKNATGLFIWLLRKYKDSTNLVKNAIINS